jgi:hypothetical protein
MPLDGMKDLLTIIELLRGGPATWVKLTVARHPHPHTQVRELMLQRQAKHGNTANTQPRQLRPSEAQSRLAQKQPGKEQAPYNAHMQAAQVGTPRRHPQHEQQGNSSSRHPGSHYFAEQAQGESAHDRAKADHGYDAAQGVHQEVNAPSSQHRQVAPLLVNQDNRDVRNAATGARQQEHHGFASNHDRSAVGAQSSRQLHHNQAEQQQQHAQFSATAPMPPRPHITEQQAAQQLGRLHITGLPQASQFGSGSDSHRGDPNGIHYHGVSLSKTTPLVRASSFM